MIQAKESNSKRLKPATFDNLTNLELSKRYNAQLSSQKRTNAASANYPKHKTHRKLKMPRVFGLLELFVRAIQTKKSLGNEALSLHSMNSILANKTCCNQTTELKTPNRSENFEEQAKEKLQSAMPIMSLKILQRLGLREFSTLIQAKESKSKTRKPAIFEILTPLELSKRYNASLNRRQRIKQAAVLRLKH